MYVMPGSPSPEGRKPGIRQTGQLVTRKGPEGSNPSPGAHLEEISICFKAHGCEREAIEFHWKRVGKKCISRKIIKTRTLKKIYKAFYVSLREYFVFLENMRFKIHDCIITIYILSTGS